jgi:hypothetical protein
LRKNYALLSLNTEQRDNLNKAKPPPIFSFCCRKLKCKKTIPKGGVKSAGGGDCE